jgi:RNA polymerase sigma factor (sigma-70 family)
MVTRHNLKYKSLTLEEERALISKCVRGDADAMDVFYQQFGRLIFSTIIKYLEIHVIYRKPSRTEREELFNQVFIKFTEDNWKKLSNFRYGCKLSSWIPFCTRNIVIDILRKEGTFLNKIAKSLNKDQEKSAIIDRESDQGVKSAHELVVEKEANTATRKLFSKILDLLEGKERDVLSLLYVRKLKPETVANLLGITRAYVDVLHARAKKNIRKRTPQGFKSEIAYCFK